MFALFVWMYILFFWITYQYGEYNTISPYIIYLGFVLFVCNFASVFSYLYEL